MSTSNMSIDKEDIEFKYGVKIYTLGEPELLVRCAEVTREGSRIYSVCL
jgi:hypothetical protein